MWTKVSTATLISGYIHLGVLQASGEIWNGFDRAGWLHAASPPDEGDQSCWSKGELAESSPGSSYWQLLGELLRAVQRLLRKSWPETTPLVLCAAPLLHHLRIRKWQWQSKATFVSWSKVQHPLSVPETWGLGASISICFPRDWVIYRVSSF